MNKFLAKIAKKRYFILGILCGIIFGGILCGRIAGFTRPIGYGEETVVTVVVAQPGFESSKEGEVGKIGDACEKEFADADISVAKKDFAKRSAGSYELRYTVNGSDEKLANIERLVEGSVSEVIDGLRDGGLVIELDGVALNKNTAAAAWQHHYVLRAAIAGIVALVATFAYISLRNRLHIGILTVGAGLISTALCIALCAVIRVPMTMTSAYGFIFAYGFSVIFSALAFGKLRSAYKLSGDKSAEEMLAENTDFRGIYILSGAVIAICIAFAILCAGETANLFIVTLVALISALLAGFGALAFYPMAKEIADKQKAKHDKFAYRRTESKKAKADDKAEGATDGNNADAD